MDLRAMMNLREYIDPQCPVITCGKWQRHLDDGWRWETNLSLDADFQELGILKDYQWTHGRVNVALGHAFSQEDLMPVPDDKLVGVYIRDVDAILSDLRKDLDNHGC